MEPACGRQGGAPPVSRFLYRPDYRRTKSECQELPETCWPAFDSGGGYTSVLRQLRGCGEDKVPTKASASSDHIFPNHRVSMGLRRIFFGRVPLGPIWPGSGWRCGVVVEVLASCHVTESRASGDAIEN